MRNMETAEISGIHKEETNQIIDSRSHLDVHLERVKLIVQSYMRRYSHRLIQSDSSYSDLCVGPQELKQILGLGAATKGQAWLDETGILPLQDIETNLALLEKSILFQLQSLSPNHTLPLEEIRAGFALTALELDLLILAAAPRLSVDISRLYVVAWSDFSVRQPTAGFLAEMISTTPEQFNRAMSCLSDKSKLIKYQLLAPATHQLWKPATPKIHAPMIVPQRILEFITGDLLDEANLEGCELFNDGIPVDELVIKDETRKELFMSLRGTRPRVCLVGSTGSGRRTVARSLSTQAGYNLLLVDLNQALSVKTTTSLLESLANILREARLHNASLFLRLDYITEDSLKVLIKANSSGIRALLEGFPGTIFMSCATITPLIREFYKKPSEIHFTLPLQDGQYNLWKRGLSAHLEPEESEKIAKHVSRNYQLPPGSIYRVIRNLTENSGRNRNSNELSTPNIIQAIRQQFDHELGWLADIVSVSMSMDEAVLTDDMREQLDEILIYAQYNEKVFQEWRFSERAPGGQGLSVLFSGPPGTGKSLVSAILARELGRVLYRVDLSRVVDKYIGETEKNLGRVFDEAERAQAVLLFDEADSLFAQRTSVKSSNDRYANLEVNYLLQRLEAYNGMSILTTNFESSMDDAFQRRIRFKIAFPMPEPEEREILWQRLIPPEAPISTFIKWHKLAKKYEFSGGHIRNAVLRAAVQAASEGMSISYRMLKDAAVAESREMGVLVRS